MVNEMFSFRRVVSLIEELSYKQSINPTAYRMEPSSALRSYGLQRVRLIT